MTHRLSTHYGARHNTPLYYGRCGDDSSAMSIDVALSTRRGVGRDTYSLPKKTRLRPQCHVNGHGTTNLRRGAVNGRHLLAGLAAQTYSF